MKHSFKLMIGLIAALGACNESAGTSSTGATRLGASPALSGGSYNTGGGITIASEIRNINGMTGVCGAWSESLTLSSKTKYAAPGVLQSATLSVNGKKVMRNLLFMRKIPVPLNYSGAEANCVRTDRPWQPGDEARRPSVHIPKQVVFKTISNAGKLTITFKPTGPGASGSTRTVYGLDLTDTENSYLSRTPTVTGGRYTSGGGITIRGDYQDIDGIAYVCGIWADSKQQSPQTENKAPLVLASGSISLNGRVVIKDLRFMQKVKAGKGLGRKLARCTSTGLPWVPGYAGQPLAISLPRQVVAQGQGQAIYFEPTGPGA